MSVNTYGGLYDYKSNADEWFNEADEIEYLEELFLEEFDINSYVKQERDWEDHEEGGIKNEKKTYEEKSNDIEREERFKAMSKI